MFQKWSKQHNRFMGERNPVWTSALSPVRAHTRLDSVYFSRALGESLRQLTALTEDFKLGITTIPAAVVTEETCLRDSTGLTLSCALDDHGLASRH